MIGRGSIPVMTGLVPVIHVANAQLDGTTWMPATSVGMTEGAA